MNLFRAAVALLGCVVCSQTSLAAAPYEELLATQAAELTARGAGPDAIAAIALLAGLDEKVDPGQLEAAVRAGLGGAGSPRHPLVAAHAALLYARLLDQRGDAAAARAARASLGLLTGFSVIGPFGEGRASFRTEFPPEREKAPPQLGSSYRGKVPDVRWRPAADAVRDGGLHLDSLLRPDTQAIAYLATFVRSDRDRSAALRLGSPGPIKVWVNGAPVFERDLVRPAALDQDAVGVRLGRGWNRILIKTAITDGAWRIHVRLTEPSGAPFSLANEPQLPAGAVAVRRSAGAAPRIETLEALLVSATSTTKSRKATPQAWLNLGYYLTWVTPRDREGRAAAAAFERASTLSPSLASLLGASDVAADDDERRRILERALQLPGLTPGWKALLVTRLAELARSQRREAQAIADWREALAIDPTFWPASLALADEEGDAGLALAALARLEKLPPAVRALPRVRRTAARIFEVAGRRPESDRELSELALQRRVDADLLHQLSGRARARGDAVGARAQLSVAARLRPDLPSLAIELSRLQEGAGTPPAQQEALVTLEELSRRLPDDAATLTALGKLLHRLGKTDEALERLRGALSLRPQDPELKRYVDRLVAGERSDPGAVDELGRRYAADVRTLLPAAGAAAVANETAVVLLDRRVVRVHRNGLSRTFAQRVVQVLTERGARENKEFAVHYTPGSEEVEIRHARIHRRDARGALVTLEATDRSDRDLSEPWYGLYYDNRAEIVQFEALRAGDVIEIQYVVEDVGSENQLADYFGDLQYIAEGIPKRSWDYTLIAPTSRPIHANVPRLTQLSHTVSEEGDDRIYRFAARDIPKIDVEPAMPGLSEVAPYLHVSTYASWADVGAWYWRLVEEQLEADDEIRRTARGLVKRGMGDEARVRAVYDFVASATRYVGLEFGIHGYKPYKVTQVLARRFGDCKDKAALMIALLREVGVNAELVLVRTRRGGRLDPKPASLAVFDHAVVYVPKLDRYFDGTAEFAGPRELPVQDQGVMVLRVGPRASVLTETPVLGSTESRVERRWQAVLEASGDARVEERLNIRGQAAPHWRQHYQSAGERADRFGRAWNGRFPGARLASVDMPDITDRNAAVTLQASVVVPRLGRVKEGGAIELPATARDADFVRTYARLSTRRHDLVLAYPWQHEEELTYRLPAGWRLVGQRPPAPRKIDTPFGHFTLEVKTEGDVVSVRSSVDIERVRISPADYQAFRSFLGEIDSALEQPLVVALPKAGS